MRKARSMDLSVLFNLLFNSKLLLTALLELLNLVGASLGLFERLWTAFNPRVDKNSLLLLFVMAFYIPLCVLDKFSLK